VGKPTVPALEDLSPDHPPPGPRDNEYVFDTELARPVVDIFRDHCGPQETERLLKDLGLDVAMHRGHRLLSVTEVRRLNHAAVERSGLRHLTYEAGLELIGPRFLGPSFYALKALALPRLAYRLLPELTRKHSRVTHWNHLGGGFLSARLSFATEDGHADDPLFCHNRQGVLAAVVRPYGLPDARVEHRECIHTGHDACVYEVRWGSPVASGMLFVGLGVGAGVAAVLLALFGGGGALGGAAALGGASALGLLAALMAERRRTKVLMQATRDQILANLEELEEQHARMSDLALVDEIDQLARAVPHLQTLVDTALTQIRDRLGFRTAVFVPVQGAHLPLPASRAQGLASSDGWRTLSMVAHLEPGPEHDALFADVLATQRGRVVDDLSALAKLVGPDNRKQLERHEMKPLLVVPVLSGSQPLGVLLLDMGGRLRLVADRERETMERLGHLLGMALDNARLVQSLEQEKESLQEVLRFTQKLSLYLPELALDEVGREEVQRHRQIQAAVLFSDIIGFTEWASQRTPAEVFSALNSYFAAMDAVVQRSSGIVDKRIGDGLMVVFPDEGAPAKPAEDLQGADRSTPSIAGRVLGRTTTMPRGGARLAPGYRALRCGLEMQALTNAPDAAQRVGPLHELGIRVGVAYGRLAAGVIGQGGDSDDARSEQVQRLEYTVIGDTVNVASRLEGIGGPGQVVTTWETLLAAGPDRFVHGAKESLQLSKRKEPIEGVRVTALRSASPPPNHPGEP